MNIYIWNNKILIRFLMEKVVFLIGGRFLWEFNKFILFCRLHVVTQWAQKLNDSKICRSCGWKIWCYVSHSKLEVFLEMVRLWRVLGTKTDCSWSLRWEYIKPNASIKKKNSVNTFLRRILRSLTLLSHYWWQPFGQNWEEFRVPLGGFSLILFVIRGMQKKWEYLL